jgi:hypothetical protein
VVPDVLRDEKQSVAEPHQAAEFGHHGARHLLAIDEHAVPAVAIAHVEPARMRQQLGVLARNSVIGQRERRFTPAAHHRGTLDRPMRRIAMQVSGKDHHQAAPRGPYFFAR